MNWLKDKWAKAVKWWQDDATHSILVARATVLFGIVLGVVQNMDLTKLFAGEIEWKTAASAVAIGVIQELARRYKAEDI